MVYAGDQWVLLPVRDLYDTLMMAIAINAAKDMYDKGEKRLDDFYTKYGDFTSPILKDMDAYNNIIGGVRDKINELYAMGVDPLRSAEGRAAVALLTRNVPIDKIAKLKQSAEAAKEYIKNRGALEAAGKWDPNFERFANNGVSLDDWDTLGDGVWNRTSPAELKTLKDLTEGWYNQRSPHMLSKEDVESFNMPYDPRNNYTGFTEKDLLDIAAGQTPGWNGSIYANYYRDIAKRKVLAMKDATGDRSPVTSDEVEAQLLKDVAIANREYIIAPREEANQFALDDHRTANDMKAYRQKAAIDHYYWKKQHPGYGDLDEYNRIFRESERNVNKKNKQKLGGNVQYLLNEQYSQWIDPALQAEQRKVKLDTGEIIPSYVFKGSTLKHAGAIYFMSDDNTLRYGKIPGSATGDYTFIPGGNMRSRELNTKNGGKIYKHYISGRMITPRGAEVNSNGNNEVWIEVVERDHNYGQNQKKE